MINDCVEDNHIVLRLTYLWVFVEGCLGGLMHLLHIPLTGFIIGGVSIIINVFLAMYSGLHVRSILGSLGLVLICKFSLSPQSPFGSYVAVSFQVLFSIVIFKLLGIHRLSILIYAILVMLENAVQKPFIAYIVFGDQLVEGILISVAKFFENARVAAQFWNVTITLYFAIYVFWGALIAHWSYCFLKSIKHFKLEELSTHLPIISDIEEVSRRNKKMKIPLYLFILSCILISYFSSTKDVWPWYAMRMIVWFVLLTYCFPYLIRLILSYGYKKQESLVMTVLTHLPGIKQNFYYSLELIKKKKGLGKVKSFLFLMIYLNVFYSPHAP